MKVFSKVKIVGLVILAISFLFLYLSYQNNRKFNDSFSSVAQTHQVIEETDELHTALLDVETSVRGYIITNNPVFLEHYFQKTDSVQKHFIKLQQLTTDNPVQQKNCKQLKGLIESKLYFQDTLLKTFQRSRSEALQLIASLTGKQLSDSIKSVLNEMESIQNKLLHDRTEATKRSTQTRFIYTIFTTLGFLGFLSLILLQIAREIKLRRKAEAISKANENKYRGIIENSAVVIFSTDLKGRFRFLSNKTLELTGYQTDELANQHFHLLVPEDWRDTLDEFYQNQLQHQRYESQLRFPIITKEGYQKWVEQSAVILKDSNGNITGFQSIVKDITETKIAEDLLRSAEQELKKQREENENRLQSILDNIPMVVYIKDLEGKFVMINRYFKETFDLSEDDIIGKYAYEINSIGSPDSYNESDERIKQTLRPYETEEIMLTREGERNMLVTKFPLVNNDNELFAICGVDKDITEMVQSRQRLISAKLRAENAEKLQEEFLANMSHEIRTPMNGIIGMANLLAETNLNQEQKEFLQLIKYSSETLHALINDILDMSKIKAGRMTIEQIDFNIREAIEGTILPLQVKAESKNVAFVKRVDGKVPHFVKGDKFKMIQILINLLGNAVKFTEKGHIELAVRMLKQEGNTMLLQFTVSDTGIGITNEHLDTIFDSFVQAGNDTTRKYGGTGLGLTITKKLVELQGGAIHVCSAKDEGTSFTFTLPFIMSENNEEYTQSMEALNRSSSQTKLAGKRILLVEDNVVNQKVTYHLLEKAGMTVSIADNGRMGVEKLEAGEQYDLVIMDLQMEEMDGMQAAAYIRNKLQMKIPIIAMTASALRNERERCFEIGFNEYMTKPFVPRELFYHLHRFLVPSDDGCEIALEQLKDKAIQEKLYDLSFIEEMEDNDYTIEILQLFLDTTPVMLQEIKEHTLHEQWDLVYQTAHKLKSSLGVIQAKQMHETMTLIETMARQKEKLEDINSLLERSNQLFKLVKPMLEAELNSVKK